MASSPSASRAATTRLLNHLWQRLQGWFITLPRLSRLLLVLLVLFLGLSVVGLLLKFISALIVVAVIAVALYGIAQVWWATQVSSDPKNEA